jgi:hypothetical protein
MSNKTIIQSILLIGAIYLASIPAEGWGWLLFFFFLSVAEWD